MKYKPLIIIVVLFIAALGLAIGERLPDISSDTNTWGSILNAFLNVSHTENGTLKKGINVSFDNLNVSDLRVQTINGTDFNEFNKSIDLSGYASSSAFSNFQLENVSNVTPYSQVAEHPDSSNFQLENVSNITAWENIINAPAYSNFKLENVSNVTPYTQVTGHPADIDTRATTEQILGNFTPSKHINITLCDESICIAVNVTQELCIELTGSSELCDGTDATGGDPDTTTYWNPINDTRNVCGMNSTNITCIDGKIQFNMSVVTEEADSLSLHLTQDNWGDDGWINWVNPNFAFNQSKLAITYYSATNASAVAGTFDDSGRLNQTNHTDGKYDSNTFNFTEVVATPGLDLRINFTNIDDFSQGVIRYKTSNLFGLEAIIQMWNYDDSVWEDYPHISESTAFATITQPVFDADDHIGTGDDLGVVRMRIYKASVGNSNNHYFVDWIAIAEGFGVPSGEEIDPYSIHTDAINHTQFNYEDGQLNMNSSYKPLNTTHSDTCSAFDGYITESQISDLTYVIFTLENVSNVTPYSQVVEHPLFSNFQLENVSNDTIGQQELIDFNNSLPYTTFTEENITDYFGISSNFTGGDNITIEDGKISINASYSSGAHTVDTDTWSDTTHHADNITDWHGGENVSNETVISYIDLLNSTQQAWVEAQGYSSAAALSNFKLENVSNVTPYTQVAEHPAFSNFQLINVSNNTWNLGDVATPSNGDTTHISTADQIYDWVIGLSYVADAWDADADIDADEISESKINFVTACAAGNHYYLSGNDLACEADDDTTYSALSEFENDINAITNKTMNVELGNLSIGNMSIGGHIINTVVEDCMNITIGTTYWAVGSGC